VTLKVGERAYAGRIDRGLPEGVAIGRHRLGDLVEQAHDRLRRAHARPDLWCPGTGEELGQPRDVLRASPIIHDPH
jgi:hypothetical protein